MSATTGLATYGSKFSFLAGRVRVLYLTHPEWRAWFFSLLAWVVLAMSLFKTHAEVMHPGNVIYCLPGAVQGGGYPVYEIQRIIKDGGILSRILTTISNDLVHWIIMVAAMMFPLLNEPIRHVAFSVRRKDRDFGILMFLSGYAMTWTIAGVVFLLLPIFLDIAAGGENHIVSGLIRGAVFLLAAMLCWLPARPRQMTKCGQTMPIRIYAWRLHCDCLFYGLKMGFACLKMCWVPMVALTLAHHNVGLMYVATIILIYERYFLSHTSKLPGYAWGIIALTVFGIEMWA